jgi:hypothetical protein
VPIVLAVLGLLILGSAVYLFTTWWRSGSRAPQSGAA